MTSSGCWSKPGLWCSSSCCTSAPKSSGSACKPASTILTKAWKFVAHDLEVRRQWPDYRKAYEALLGATSTAVAPWTVVPSDSKTHRDLMIGTVVRDTLKSMKLRYPPPAPEIAGARVP